MSGLWAIFAYAALSVGLCSIAAAQAVVIGAKEFTEQLLVAEMTAQLLRASGLSPHKGTGFATTGVRTLQERGIVDVYWEYTGTSLITFLSTTTPCLMASASSCASGRAIMSVGPPAGNGTTRWMGREG